LKVAIGICEWCGAEAGAAIHAPENIGAGGGIAPKDIGFAIPIEVGHPSYLEISVGGGQCSGAEDAGADELQFRLLHLESKFEYH
jgi:hypothetical protein